MDLQCYQCGTAFRLDSDGRLPPWCRCCGADRKRSESSANAEKSAPAPSPAVSSAGLVPNPDTYADIEDWLPVVPDDEQDLQKSPSPLTVAGQPKYPLETKKLDGMGSPYSNSKSRYPGYGKEELDSDILSDEERREWDDRFSLNNLLFGFALAVWGGFQSLNPDASAGAKFLDSHDRLCNMMSMLQLATLGNGIMLFVAGCGIKNRTSWGYPLAMMSGVTCILAGALFLLGFQSLGNPGGDLVHAVGRLQFITSNLDLLTELVGGVFLLFFIFKIKAKQETSEMRRMC